MDSEEVKAAILSGDVETIPPIPSKVVRIFVSSTFGDTVTERNNLLDKAYPMLHEWCTLHDLEFQVVDMRWGVRDAASAYHMTTALCLREIKNCMRLSLGPNFMFILGQRYGWRPSPASIDAAVYRALLGHVTEEAETSLLARWYLLDENSSPPVYALQPITENNRAGWKVAGVRLPAVLRKAASLAAEAGEITEEARHVFFMSVTEQELRVALEVEHPDDHCVGFLRTLDGLSGSLSDVQAGNFCDVSGDGTLDEEAGQLLERLKTVYTPARLSPGNIHRYSIPWLPAGVTAGDGEHRGYIRQFTRTFAEDVKRLVLRAKERLAPTCNLLEDWLLEEVAHHAEFCRSKCRSFRGCEDTLGRIFAALVDRSVVLHGPSGSGKTSIVAVVAQRARRELGPSAVVVLRFLGTSSRSSSVLQVLRSVCLQVCAVYGLAPPSQGTLESFQETAAFFHAALQAVSAGPGQQRPLLIALDSLDQLEGLHGAHKCRWLPKSRLPHVHLLVSTLPEMYGIRDSLESLLAGSARFLPVGPLSESTGVEILETWMREIQRRITEEQAKIVKQAGLSHSELEDILSLDDEVLDEIYQYWSPPSEDFVRIPPLMWSRLKYELEEYLVERQTDGKTVMVLYHRQFTEAARDRYLCDAGEKRKRHQVLAEFFTGIWSGGRKKTLNLSQRKEVYSADRLVTSQPLKRHKTFNYRKLSELPYHLLHAHNTGDLVAQALGNFDFLEALTMALSAQHLIEELNWVLERESILGKSLHTELKLLQDTIRLAKSTLDFQDNSQPLAVEILGRLHHLATEHTQCIGRIVQGAREQCERVGTTLLVPTRPCFYMPGGPLRTTLMGHTGNILKVAVNPSCSMLATASADGSVRLWELDNDEDIHVLHGQRGGAMACVAISPDDQWVVAGSDQNYLQVWSIHSGDPVLLIEENHASYSRYANVAVTRDASRIISSSENDLMVYNITTGDRLHAFTGHTNLISCICISPADDRCALSGSDDGTARVWSLANCDAIGTVAGHAGTVTHVALTADLKVVSAGMDGQVVIAGLPSVDEKCSPQTLHVLKTGNGLSIYSACLSGDETRVIAGTLSIAYIWDVASGSLLHSLGGHDGVVDCVAVTHDNTHLVSGARDDIMAVWDLASGRKVQTLEGQQSVVSHLALANQLVVSASLHSPYIKLWDISPKYLHQQRMTYGDRSGLVAATADQRYVIFKGIDPFAETSVHNIHVWEARTGLDKYVLRHHTDEVTCLEVSHGRERPLAFTGSRDATVAVWDLQTGKLRRTFAGHGSAVRRLSVQSDDRRLASLTCEGAVFVWDLKHLRRAAELPPPDSPDSADVTCLALAPQGQLLLTGTSAGEVHLRCWAGSSSSSSTAPELGTLTGGGGGQGSGVRSLALTGDGSLVAAAHEEPFVVLWHLANMQKLHQLKAGSVSCMGFTSDNQFLVTGANDRKLLLWNVTDGSLVINLYTYSNLTDVRVSGESIIACTKIGQLMAFAVHLPGQEEGEDRRSSGQARPSRISLGSIKGSGGESQGSSGSLMKSSRFCSLL